MDPIHPNDLRADLHQLVDRLCEAPAAERKSALTRLMRRARLYLQLQAYQDERAQPPPPAEPEAPAPPPVLEGAFVRLLAGGKLLTAAGEHLLSEEDTAAAGLQHGDFVRATPSDDAVYTYKALRGPLIDPAAEQIWGHVEPLDEDLALVRTPRGEEITVSRREMKARGATLDSVLKVAYLLETGQFGRHLGRVLEVHHPAEGDAAAQVSADRTRQKRPGPAETAARSRRALPQFQPSGNRRPRIVVVGGHPPSRAKFAQIMADYGADLTWLPYSPKAKVVRHAVRSSDIVIGMTHCCRTGHWESAVETSRACNKLLFCGESENESGLRHQIEREIIPRWNERAAMEEMAK